MEVHQEADWFMDQTIGREKKPDIIMHDRDTKRLSILTLRCAGTNR